MKEFKLSIVIPKQFSRKLKALQFKVQKFNRALAKEEQLSQLLFSLGEQLSSELKLQGHRGNRLKLLKLHLLNRSGHLCQRSARRERLLHRSMLLRPKFNKELLSRCKPKSISRLQVLNPSRCPTSIGRCSR